MSYTPETGSLVGQWTYRSFLNDPDPATAFNDLEFGLGTIEIAQAPAGIFKGAFSARDGSCSSTAGSATGIPAPSASRGAAWSAARSGSTTMSGT